MYILCHRYTEIVQSGKTNKYSDMCKSCDKLEHTVYHAVNTARSVCCIRYFAVPTGLYEMQALSTLNALVSISST